MGALAGHLSNGIEDVLEEDEGGAPCNLGDVEQRLTGHVADFGVWVSEAGHHRRDQLRQVNAHTLLCAGRSTAVQLWHQGEWVGLASSPAQVPQQWQRGQGGHPCGRWGWQSG